ncbi:MAG: hypothetical protein AAGF30_04190 [Pseudomonadota bacterium]
MTDRETPEDEDARPAIWPYVVMAIVGSLAGAGLDELLYTDGGSMLTKVGLVAGPVLYHVFRKMRRSA